MMEGFESHQRPAAPEEMREADASFGTGEEYCSDAEEIIASPLTNEKRGVLHDEEEWAKDELVELMQRAVEERDACREELEVLREHSAALEDEKNQLINRRSGRKLRLDLGRLLVSFISTLHLETADYNSNVIDQILIQFSLKL
ncbi:putative MORC family CW-type zinc finger protein 3-like [Triplophysa rosa]|uniref:MORC family CW-type zinc finger protein 3-like n=1 Tax=Triplophysa rosa TaxID=992332 RepID=A0A9W7WZG9_TRIRA|nr:putative MORC family CW-type zinc finger protein 3-like [Triplophysa rosa]